ncbi:glycosyltransferase involved in cell wall biosynthesis [Rhodoblastus acidophilus]|uniref:glycosyltransferase family 2 protein n=1 Tax=Rhodoblastus acidophilus TaxID=1074 RepID=UPI00222439BE|nr:glycosyltransferase family 2 protein [Rhodoblastus acidophilus]MCW2284825.1 glycosyltransferase involved in cell wall biosynthesis [Rhodoblastus acidophilus]MCW2333885.1 glycosyltransferase involved in cell wall biosynthesis [Rhodoblastus acidophilus]
MADGADEGVSIVIPTMNSQSYISIIADYYEGLGLNPYWFVDQKSADRTFDVLAARSQRVVAMHNDTAIIEAMVEKMSRAAPTDWVLRIDDDELPTAQLFAFARAVMQDGRFDALGFVRHQCGVTADGSLMAHSGHDPNVHRQYRLYRKDRVAYRSDVHTPGFHFDGLSVAHVGAEHCLIHLDWAIRSYAERKRKVMNYNQARENAGDAWKAYYLPEDDAAAPNAFVPLEKPEFAPVAQALARLFPDNTIEGQARQSEAFKRIA